MSGRTRRVSGAPAKRARKRSSRPAAAPKPKARPRRGRRALVVALLLALGIYTPLLAWAHLSGPGPARPPQEVSFPETCDASALSEQLAARGLIRSPGWFRWYVRLAHPALHCAQYPHLLSADLSASALVERIDDSPLRPTQRVALPEGLDQLEIAQRLESARVCSARAFRATSSNPTLLAELGLSGASAEGYLFPATYGLHVDSDATEVVRTLVAEARKRLARLKSEHPGAFESLAERGLSERDVLTLASMVEKEAHVAEERAQIASVFFNRLSDPDFRPARMLQSDPTAAYGCRLSPDSAPSCAGFAGKVTPAMLRDATNLYNTYRHPGLPPGPIANPGEASIAAVLAPAATDYLYFVAKGGGRHAFSRTFGEHRDAIESSRTP